MSDFRDDNFPLPWAPAPHAPWLLLAANGRQVAHFQAWNDWAGSLIISEKHCAMTAYAVNEMARKEEPAPYLEQLQLADVDINMNDLRNMQRLVVMWADSAMPDRTPANALLKLFEEIGELIRNPQSAAEYADILIMLVDLAAMHGVSDLGSAVRDKMKINANRKWVKTPTGTMQHLESVNE